jgi:OPA family glycerol-3-phosphate transporter-like MFS transporter
MPAAGASTEARSADRRRMLRWQVVTLGLLLLLYTGCYLCRSNFAVTLSLVQETLVEQGYTPDAAQQRLGTIASLGVLAYAIGKFFTGSVADFLGGRRNILSGMLASVAFTLLFAAGGSVPLFTLAWFGNRLVQSFVWTGMVKVTGKWFSYSAYGTAMGIVSLSYLFGDAAARRFMGWLLAAGLGWREVFGVAAGVLFVLLAASWLWLKESPVVLGLPEPPANPANVFGAGGHEAQPPGLRELLVPLVTSPVFLVVCFLSLGLTLLRETFNTWSAYYFTDALGLAKADAANRSALFPLLGGVSVLVAGWIGDRLGQGGRAAVILLGCLGSTVVLAVLGAADFASATLLPVALVSLVGFLLLGPYSYLAGAISLDLGGKRGGATACGIIDGVGYLGAMAAGDSIARLEVAYGWSATFQALAAVAMLTSAGAAVFFRMQRAGAAVQR